MDKCSSIDPVKIGVAWYSRRHKESRKRNELDSIHCWAWRIGNIQAVGYLQVAVVSG